MEERQITENGDLLLLTDDALDEQFLSNFIKAPTAGANCIFVGTTRDSFHGRPHQPVYHLSLNRDFRSDGHQIGVRSVQQSGDKDVGTPGLGSSHIDPNRQSYSVTFARNLDQSPSSCHDKSRTVYV